MLAGDNSILQKATDAKKETERGQEKEIVALAYNSALAKKVSNGDSTAVTAGDLNTELTNQGATANGSSPIKVTFTASKRQYTVNNGVVDYAGIKSEELLDITQNKWKVVNEDESETYTKYKFNEDGTYNDGTYILNGNTLTLNYADGFSEIWEYNGDYFLLKQDGYDNEMTEVIDVYKLINFIPDTFTFYIDHASSLDESGVPNVEYTVEHTAENGMTWGDWVNSEYNTIGAELFGPMGYICGTDFDELYYPSEESGLTDVKSSSLINSIHYVVWLQ